MIIQKSRDRTMSRPRRHGPAGNRPGRWHEPLACGPGLATRLFAQPASDGALPILYAATANGVHGGEYFGPDGPGERRGHHPKLVPFSAAARDEAAAARLWAVSEELTGVTFEPLTAK